MSSQIHDLGYRPYEGERAGVAWAVRSLAVHSMRRALGLKRAGRHKIVPTLTIGFAFLPAIVMVGLSLFLSGFSLDDLFSYGDYHGFTSFALFLFTAAAAPGVLTTDRTSGMLAMYLASPLNRTTYVLAKGIGIFAVMFLVTVAPIVFLVVAYTIVGAGPGGLLDFLELMGRALLAGAISAAFYTGLGIFVSSIPKRWGIASVSIIAALVVPSIVTGILTEGAQAPDWVAYMSPAAMMGKAWEHILGDVSFNGLAIDRLSGSLVVLAAVAYAAAFLAMTWWRYQNVEVDR
ncbi:MAG: ABC transporter permease subunit [Acidimicrobiales bacterium]|jgi:ABC-2 type transport system permease protein